MLAACPTAEWHGGQVQFIRPSVIHLKRGQVFDIDGRRFFTMGGASSHGIQDGILEPRDPDFKMKRAQLDARDAFYRINHVSRWKKELPSEAEYQTALANLDACGWKVDYIISHCCPTSIAGIISRGTYRPDALTDFFEQQFILLYEQIVELE